MAKIKYKVLEGDSDENLMFLLFSKDSRLSSWGLNNLHRLPLSDKKLHKAVSQKFSQEVADKVVLKRLKTGIRLLKSDIKESQFISKKDLNL